MKIFKFLTILSMTSAISANAQAKCFSMQELKAKLTPLKVADAATTEHFQELMRNPSNRISAGFGFGQEIKSSKPGVLSSAKAKFLLYHLDMNNDGENEYVIIPAIKRTKIQAVLKEKRDLLIELGLGRLKIYGEEKGAKWQTQTPFLAKFDNKVAINALIVAKKKSCVFEWRKNHLIPVAK